MILVLSYILFVAPYMVRGLKCTCINVLVFVICRTLHGAWIEIALLAKSFAALDDGRTLHGAWIEIKTSV